MGNGKSTTGNALSKHLMQSNGEKFTKGMTFLASKSSEAVTTQLTMKYFEPWLNIMDTPGFNDPNKSRSDKAILSQIVDTIQTDNDIWDHGLACLLQCVMVPASGRIQKSAIAIMSKFLQVFTLSYADSDQIGPKFLVIFTNYSRFECATDAGNLSYDEEDDEETADGAEEVKQSADPQDQKDEKSYIPLETYISSYKKDLINQLMED